MVDLRVGPLAGQMAVWWVGRTAAVKVVQMAGYLAASRADLTVVGRVALWVVLWVVQMAASTVV
jgi:hypothetical protein